MKSREHVSHDFDVCACAHKHGCMLVCIQLFSGMLRPISQPNWDRSERTRYLRNQEIMPDLSEHIIWPEHTSQHACMLCACVHRPISQPNWVRSERQRYLRNRGDMLVMTMMSVHVHTSMHACWCACTLFSGVLRPISQPIQVRLEGQRYLWNQGDISVMTMVFVHVHTSMHIC